MCPSRWIVCERLCSRLLGVFLTVWAYRFSAPGYGIVQIVKNLNGFGLSLREQDDALDVHIEILKG